MPSVNGSGRVAAVVGACVVASVVGVAGVMSMGAGASASGAAGSGAQGGAGVAWQYAVLSTWRENGKVSVRAEGSPWRFSSPFQEFGESTGAELAKKLGTGVPEGKDEEMVLVNALANSGWELVTHSLSDAGFDNPRDGTGYSGMLTKEEWWFRKERGK